MGTLAPSQKTQRGKILALLLAARGGWVPAYEIARFGLQFSARLLELRRAGFDIQNKTARVGKQVHSWYRLQLGSPAPAPELVPASPNPSPPSEAKQTSMFTPAELRGGRWRDPEEP